MRSNYDGYKLKYYDDDSQQSIIIHIMDLKNVIDDRRQFARLVPLAVVVVCRSGAIITFDIFSDISQKIIYYIMLF